MKWSDLVFDYWTPVYALKQSLSRLLNYYLLGFILFNFYIVNVVSLFYCMCLTALQVYAG